MNSSDVKCYWSDGLVKNALFDNILYTINKFYFDRSLIGFLVMQFLFSTSIYIYMSNYNIKYICTIYTRLYTCLTPIPRFALRDKVTTTTIEAPFLGSGCSRVV